MDLTEILKRRFSVRFYTSEIVPEDVLQRILEAGILAPTSTDKRAFRLLVIRTQGKQEELSDIFEADWPGEAPLIIGVVGLPEKSGTRNDGKNYNDIDCAIVMDHIILTAVKEGLGTCWIGDFDVDKAREILGIPDDLEPVAFTPLGHPQPGGAGMLRILPSIEDVVMYDTWDEDKAKTDVFVKQDKEDKAEDGGRKAEEEE